MTQFSVAVNEYESARPGNPLATSNPPFVFNDRQLVIEIVRAILTANPGKESRKYVAAIVRPTLQFLLDWSSAPNLCVSSKFNSLVRDFSLNARIGELAQGVGCAYWKWVRGYSWISDFTPWARGLGPTYKGPKAPDFVMFNMGVNGLAVMEAKGTQSNEHKPKMWEALRQCRCATAHPAFDRGYGTVLALGSNAIGGSGTLHIRDPESLGEDSSLLRHHAFRRSYASWFEMSGNEEMAEWCRLDLRDGGPRGRPVFKGAENLYDPLRQLTAVAMGLDPLQTRFEIAESVVDMLSSLEYFRSIDGSAGWSSELQAISDSDRSITFPDGTRIVEY